MPADLTRTAAQLADRLVTSRQLIDAALSSDPARDNIFILRLDEAARAAAARADDARQMQDPRPFLGVPITIKDNFDLAGHATTAGSLLLRDAPGALADAAVVTRLKKAGFVLLGRTNMTEFAFSGLGLNSHYGTPINPAFAQERRIAGGSSSGAAASVALGLAPVAIGTDTGGSVRIPASFCGLTGFKPSATAICANGVLPLSPSLDAVGIIARTVSDCAALFKILRESPRTIGPEPAKRIGLIENYVFDGAEPAVILAIATAVAKLEDAGWIVERLHFPALDTIANAMAQGTFAGAEAYSWHEPFLHQGREHDYDPRVVSRILAGKSVDAVSYARLGDWRRGFVAAFGATAASFDALAWPTVPMIAPRLEDLRDDDAYFAVNAKVLRNSTIANLAAACAISIPCPASAPVGMTLAAAGGSDDLLLSVAAAAETALTQS